MYVFILPMYLFNAVLLLTFWKPSEIKLCNVTSPHVRLQSISALYDREFIVLAIPQRVLVSSLS